MPAVQFQAPMGFTLALHHTVEVAKAGSVLCRTCTLVTSGEPAGTSQTPLSPTRGLSTVGVPVVPEMRTSLGGAAVAAAAGMRIDTPTRPSTVRLAPRVRRRMESLPRSNPINLID